VTPATPDPRWFHDRTLHPASAGPLTSAVGFAAGRTSACPACRRKPNFRWSRCWTARLSPRRNLPRLRRSIPNRRRFRLNQPNWTDRLRCLLLHRLSPVRRYLHQPRPRFPARQLRRLYCCRSHAVLWCLPCCRCCRQWSMQAKPRRAQAIVLLSKLCLLQRLGDVMCGASLKHVPNRVARDAHKRTGDTSETESDGRLGVM
jgi:hypothetical protein